MNTLLQFHLTNRNLIGIAFCLLILTTDLFAQNERIDSLKQKLASTSESESFEINYQLAREFTEYENKTALGFAKKAWSVAFLKSDSLNIVRSLRLLGQVHRRLDNLDSSIHYFLTGLPIANRNHFDEERNFIYNGLGIAYTYTSKFDQALYYLIKCLALREQIGDKASISIVQNNIGLVYYKLRDYKMALKYFNECLIVKMSINYTYELETLFVNISLCHVYLGDLEAARARLNPVTEKCLVKCNDNLFVNAFFASGVIWYEAGSLDKAEKDFIRSYTIAKKINNQRFLFDNINCLSEVYLKQGRPLWAEKFLNEGKKMIRTTQLDREKMRLFEQLCALQKVIGNNYKLSFYNEKYIQMKDSISNTTKTNKLMSLHSEALEKENKTQLASQEQTLQLKDEIIKKQLGINILIGIAVPLLVFLIYVLIKILKQRKEANYLLNKKVLERSNELLQNQQSLKLAIEQRDTALTKLSQDLNHSIKFMRSLCRTGTNIESDSNTFPYFDEINNTTLNLSSSLQSILP